MSWLSHIDPTTVLQCIAVFSSMVAAVCAVASVAVSYCVYRKQSSPDVIVYENVPESTGMMLLYIENIGNAPAYDVSIVIDGDVPMTEASKNSMKSGPLKNGIAFMPPGGKRMIPLAPSYDYVKAMVGNPASAAVSFARSKGGAKSSSTFIIEGDSFAGCIVGGSVIKDGLDSISESIKAAARDR